MELLKYIYIYIYIYISNFHQRNQYYFISDEKYEFNQSFVLLLVKSIQTKYLKRETVINFYVNLIDCDILYVKALAYSLLGLLYRRKKPSEKFYKYYLNALDNKREKGNILDDDFDNGDVKSVEDKFNELFSEEFRG